MHVWQREEAGVASVDHDNYSSTAMETLLMTKLSCNVRMAQCRDARTAILISGIAEQYFIDSGRATVLIDGKEVGVVEEGQFFGEFAFVATLRNLLKEDAESSVLLETLGLANTGALEVMRMAAVKAVVQCRCMELNVKNFLVAFQNDVGGLVSAMR
jgi:CRP-like cAMP-binding protein